MARVKVNVFLSYAPEDRQQLQKLLRWLYPMRDEVNLWFHDPPQRPPALSLPWQILLFWYSPPDPRIKYAKIYEKRREKAHIYLFLTSYKSLSNKTVAADVAVAIQRRLEEDNALAPLVFPVLLSPSRWKETSPLAGFSPLAAGKPLSSYSPEEEGFLTVTEELSTLIKTVQSALAEEKYYQSRPIPLSEWTSNTGKRRLPYLGESPELLEFDTIEPFYAPEWLGWSLIFFILISVISNIMPTRIVRHNRYENIRSASDHGSEFLREHRMVPTKDSFNFPPADQ
jgi:hypothetical protein